MAAISTTAYPSSRAWTARNRKASRTSLDSQRPSGNSIAIGGFLTLHHPTSGLTRDGSASRHSKQLRRINVTRRLLMSSFSVGGEAHEPTRPDVLATAAPPASTRGDPGCPPLPADPRRLGVRPWSLRRRHRPHARSHPKMYL